MSENPPQDADTGRDYVDRFGPLTAEEAIRRSRLVIADQPNVRDEAKWADAFYAMAVLIGRVRTPDDTQVQIRRLKDALKTLAGCDDEQVELIAHNDGPVAESPHTTTAHNNEED